MSETFKRMSAVTDLFMSHGMLPNERIFFDIVRNVAAPHVEHWLARRAEIGQAAEVIDQVKKKFYDILSPSHPTYDAAYKGREHDLLRYLFNEVFDGSFKIGDDVSVNGQAVARILGPAFATFEDPANLLNRLRALSRAKTKAKRQADKAAEGYEVTDIFKSLQEGAAKNETLQSFERDRLIPWFKSIKGENARYSRKAARELLKIHKAEGSVFAQAATRSDFDRFLRDILGGDIARVGSAVNRYGTQESAIGFRHIPGKLNEEF